MRAVYLYVRHETNLKEVVEWLFRWFLKGFYLNTVVASFSKDIFHSRIISIFIRGRICWHRKLHNWWLVRIMENTQIVLEIVPK